MAKIYYQAATNSLFSDDLHGPREITVRDPDWIAPAPVEGQTEFQHPPTITVANPDCMLPADVVEITAERHAELMAGQGAGKQIVAGDDGLPTLVDQEPFTLERLAADMRAKRTALLAASDWTQIADSPLPPAIKAAWATYRQALRDFMATPGADWPVPPGS